MLPPFRLSPFPLVRNHHTRSVLPIEHPIRITCQILILQFVEFHIITGWHIHPSAILHFSFSKKAAPAFAGAIYILSRFLLFRLPFLPRKSCCLRAAFAVPDLPSCHERLRQLPCSPTGPDSFLSASPFLPLTSSFFIILLLCDYIITYYISFVNTFLIIL